MGQTPSYIVDSAGNQTKLSNDYVVIVKEDWCSVCKGLTNLLKQIPGATTSNNIHRLTLKDVDRQVKFGSLVRQAYKQKKAQFGSIPLLLRVRNGRLVASQVGSGDLQNVANFMAGLKL